MRRVLCIEIAGWVRIRGTHRAAFGVMVQVENAVEGVLVWCCGIEVVFDVDSATVGWA